jgi:Predicted membrane protein
MVKLSLYIVMIPITMWVLECVKMDNIFKKGRELQIKILFVMISFALAYLVTNFLYDFALSTVLT